MIENCPRNSGLHNTPQDAQTSLCIGWQDRSKLLTHILANVRGVSGAIPQVSPANPFKSICRDVCKVKPAFLSHPTKHRFTGCLLHLVLKARSIFETWAHLVTTSEIILSKELCFPSPNLIASLFF